jgi:hypothetical protein
MQHDVILVLCSLLIYAGLMWSSTRIAAAIHGFQITITAIPDKKSVDIPAEVKQHG